MKSVYAGIDLGGSFVKAGLLAPDGKRIYTVTIPSNSESGSEAAKKSLLGAAQRLIDFGKKNRYTIKGMGIGTPGTVIYPEGIVTGSSPNIPGWIGTDIGALFGKIPFKTRVDNDANCMALGEYHFGAGKGCDSGFYVTVGTGIGGAVILGGKILRGHTFAAGEFGHTVLKYNGLKCKCGRRGCVEVYSASAGLVRSARKAVKRYGRSSLKTHLDSLTPRLIIEAYKKGDKAAVEAMSQNAEMIGSAIGSVVNLLNPAVVVVGGGIAGAGKNYISKIRENIKKTAFESATSGLKVRSARLGNEAGWVGAACLLFSKGAD